MLSGEEIRQLWDQARRNEEILLRLDQVEEFLLAHHGLKELLRHLCRRVGQTYQLESVTLILAREHAPLIEVLQGPPTLELPEGCFLRTRQEVRLLLADLERPFLSNRLTPDLLECFFPDGPFLASMAALPLWVRGEMLGTLNLGSASPQRYRSDFETHFLSRLGRKVAIGMDAALLRERTSYLERRQAAVEMAGAACHELSQPLTTVNLLLDRLRRNPGVDQAEGEILGQLEQEMERVERLLKRISQVSDYVTRPYVNGLKIVDLEAASPDTAGPDRPGPDKKQAR